MLLCDFRVTKGYLEVQAFNILCALVVSSSLEQPLEEVATLREVRIRYWLWFLHKALFLAEE